MRDAMRRLARDDWVLGIAAAIAIGYALTSFVRAIAGLALDAASSDDATCPFTASIGGRVVSYESVLATALTLLAVIAISAVVVRHARSGDDE